MKEIILSRGKTIQIRNHSENWFEFNLSMMNSYGKEMTVILDDKQELLILKKELDKFLESLT